MRATMQRKTTWWRNLGGLLVACVLTLLVAAPMTSAAACLCIEDSAPAASLTVQADHQQDSAPCKAACCLGGHCHHAGPALEAPVSTIAVLAPMAARHEIAPAHALPSLTVSTLDRPPRG